MQDGQQLLPTVVTAGSADQLSGTVSSQ